MNQELIDMARQADIDHHRLWNDDGTNRLEAFAALVAAAEREKLAKQWEQWHGFDKHTVAAFIRARGGTK
jgi:hypothetical protein